MSLEEPGLREALGGQQPHKLLGSGQVGRGGVRWEGVAIARALAAAVLGEEAQAGNDPQTADQN